MLEDDAPPVDLLLLDLPPRDPDTLQLARDIQRLSKRWQLPTLALVPSDSSVTDLQAILPETLIKPLIPLDARPTLERLLMPAPTPTTPQADTSAPSVVPRRILLADDSLVNQEVAKGLLQMRSHHVTCVGDGRQAVNAARAEVFDLILMDVEMPEMDGLQAAQLVRAMSPSAASTPRIIAMTARCESELQFGDSGVFDGYLAKPIDPQRLFAMVEFADGRGKS